MNMHAPLTAADRDRAKAAFLIYKLYADAERHAQEMERLHPMILRIAAEAQVDAKVAVDGAAAEVVPEKRLAPRDRSILTMWRQGKISAPQFLAAERVTALIRLKERTQKVVAWANGGGGGGSADAIPDGLARALDAASQWAMLQARILMDDRCGGDIEHRRRTFAVLELACGAEMSVAAIVRARRDLGNRRDVMRRLKTGLQVVAESLGDLKAHRDEAAERAEA